MTLRKITINSSVRYLKKSEQTGENKPNMMKNKTQSEQIKQNKNISQNNKRFLKNVAASGFGKLTKQYLYNVDNINEY